MNDVIPASDAGFGADFGGVVDAEVVASTTRHPQATTEEAAHEAAARAAMVPDRRVGTIERVTGETSVRVDLDLDGAGDAKVATGIGFFDHMLGQIARHGGFDLTVETIGDLHVDAHHTIEDTALALGAALAGALGDKSGVRRFGSALVPLDEVLVQAAVDLSGRPYVVHDEPPLAPYVGPVYPTSMTRHVWESFGHAARITLHVSVLRANRPGSAPDAHHVVEAQFKAVARALRDAVSRDARSAGVPSTKGVL
jgi:imidazoleglycerol-phosphate dehydratase